MYSQKLEELISLVLSDGTLTEQKRDIIKRRAEKEGENVDEVMMIVESRLQKQTPRIIKVENKPIESVNNLIVPENVMRKVLKIMEGYNKKAEKWGYKMLRFDTLTHTINGKFTPKTDAQDSKAGFIAGMKEAYKNGDLGGEWGKILKLCNRFDMLKKDVYDY